MDDNLDDETSCRLDAFPYAVVFTKNNSVRILDNKNVIKLKKTDRFFWHNLDYTDKDTFGLLVNEYGLSPDVASALCDDCTRPRYFHDEEGVVLILRGINYNQGCDPEDMVSLRIWVDKNKIITLAHRRLKVINQMHQKIKRGFIPPSPMQLFLTISQMMVDGINDAIIQISEDTDNLEEKVINTDASEIFGLRNQISEMRREIITIRRYTAPQKEIFMSLQNDKLNQLCEEDRDDIREILNDITKAVEDLDYCRDHLSVFSEELQSKMSVSMTNIMYVISLVTVIFTPLTMLTGLLGINVRGIPFADYDYAFWGVCVIMVIMVIISFWVMRRLKWL